MTRELERYAYVVVFSPVTVREFTAVIDRLPVVLNWMTVLPQTVFIVSTAPALQLTDILTRNVPGVERILVLDADTDRNGKLPPTAWDFLRHRQTSTTVLNRGSRKVSS